MGGIHFQLSLPCTFRSRLLLLSYYEWNSETNRHFSLKAYQILHKGAVIPRGQ